MTPRLQPRTDGLPPEVVPRVLLTLSADDCDALPKVEGAGEVREHEGRRVQVMHNGVLVEAGGYFGDWMSEVIRCLRGHHEPQEELAVARVLEQLRATGTTSPRVVELGSFWAYYSLWALQEFPLAHVLCLEPDPDNLELGRRNAALNGREITFVHGVLGREPGSPTSFLRDDGSTVRVVQYGLREVLAEAGADRVDLLFCDTQGAEGFLFEDAVDLLRDGRVRFAVVSTHHHSISGDPLTHQRVLGLLRECGAHVVAEHTVGESVSGDGLVVVSFDERDAGLEVGTTLARQSESLFGPLEADLAASWERVAEQGRALAHAQERGAEAAARAQDAERERDALHARLAQLEQSRLMRWTEPLRGVYARARTVLHRPAAPAGAPAPTHCPPAPAAPAAPPEPDLLASVRALTPLAATTGRPRLLFATDDAVVGRELFERGSFDRGEMQRAVEVARRVGRSGGCFVDVGANIGTSTVLALQELGFERAVCFEPDELNAQLLRCNLVLNGLEARATVTRVAISDRRAEGELELAADNRGDHRLRADGPSADGAYGEAARSTTRVPVVPLDQALQEQGVSPHELGLVWVDTQGHEAQVLAGATRTLAAGVPFVVELWPYGLRRAGGLERFQQLVREHVAAFVDVREDGRVRPAQEVTAVVERLQGTEHTDLVLLPRVP